MELKDFKDGMYIRTVSGHIFKIEDYEFEIVKSFSTGEILYKSNNIKFYPIHKEPKYKLTDLIEVDDYINGDKINDIENFTYDSEKDKIIEHETQFIIGNEEGMLFLTEKDIETIVTKEQFSSVSYKLGKEGN